MDEMTIRTARRAADRPYFLAFGLQRYSEEQDMDEAALMAALGATPETLAGARLCRTPRPDPAGMREDVDRIAEKFGLNVEVLRAAVAAGRVAEVHTPAAEQGVPEDAAPVLAARDRSDGGTSEPGT